MASFDKLTEYTRHVGGLVRGLWNGSLTRYEFSDNLMTELRRGMTFAWMEGAAYQGIQPNEVGDEERLLIQDNAIDQVQYVPGFARFVEDHNKASGAKLSDLTYRSRLWINRYGEMIERARLYYAGDKKLKWVLSPAEHCKSCLALSGKVYRKSTWERYNLYPKSASLQCMMNCKCSFLETDEPVSKGKPSRMFMRKEWAIRSLFMQGGGWIQSRWRESSQEGAARIRRFVRKVKELYKPSREYRVRVKDEDGEVVFRVRL